MIKFFNKIRKQLLDENKTGRYFKYAIGEIILVMIGILLALQVNNWNQNRQLQKEEVMVLKNFYQEFSENSYMKDIFIEDPALRKEMVFIINLLESEIKKHNQNLVMLSAVKASQTKQSIT